MITAEFDYKRAGSVEEALAMLAEGNGDAKILGGGHSLIPAMKLRLNMPGTLIDISRIESLRYIRQDGNTLCIGAAATHDDIDTSDLVARMCPALQQTAGLIGDVQVRNKGTIGGAMAHGDPAADYPGALLVSGATVVMQSASGSREVSASDFFTGLFETALEENEIITEVRIPGLPDGANSVYLKFMQPASRYAIVGCAVQAHMRGNVVEDIRVAFTSVADHAFRDTAVENAMKGSPAVDKKIEEAAAHAAKDIDPLEDHFASADYRRHLARVYAKRAINAATQR